VATEYLLEMENITKTFPGVKALDNVEMKVRKGTVHAFMGENGAGKSTLMKCLMGIYIPDGGTITFKGEKLELKTATDALNAGLSMIHQELSPVLHRSVAENIWLGREPVKGPLRLVDHKKMNEMTRELLKNLELDIDPTVHMSELTVGRMQMVEIAKATSYNASLIVMDEPTSAITEKEVEHLFKIINKLRAQGVAIIYITHKMDEVFKIADDITVLRDGQFIGRMPASELNDDSLISLMVGRELSEVFPKTHVPIGDVKLEVKNMTKEGMFKNVSFTARKGEILGVAGLMGAGRTEVMETLFGVNKKDAGEVYIDGKKVEINSPADAINNKIALLTEDRKGTGCYLVLSVEDNMYMASIDKFIKGGFLDKKSIREECEEYRKKLTVKTSTLDEKIGNLSGGNQQKALIARWLMTHPDILILDEPTRGIDVGAKSEIHKLMCKLAGEGKTVIMISSELPEVLGMADRIMVMHEGEVTGIVDRKDANQELLLKLATGE
jgi:ABC-type sugar transport system ATPase subunit